MRKLSQINELWSKGLNRSKSNDVRLGDKIHSNIDELKPVDLGLPFLIADDDLCIDDEYLISLDEYLENYKKYVESKGWRLPTKVDIDDMERFPLVYDKHMSNNDVKVYISGPEKGQLKLNFDILRPKMMWCDDLNSKGNCYCWTCVTGEIVKIVSDKQLKKRLRLIKDK